MFCIGSFLTQHVQVWIVKKKKGKKIEPNLQLKSDKRLECFSWNEPVMRHKGFICSEREQHLKNHT